MQEGNIAVGKNASFVMYLLKQENVKFDNYFVTAFQVQY
jgi:hypothetical protein